MINIKSLKVAIYLSIIGIVGICLDFILSLFAYNSNNAYFYAFEQNREIANFFMFGDFPFMFIFTIISIPAAIMLWTWFWIILKDFEHREFFLFLVSGIYIFMFLTRLAAGLTWFTDSYEFYIMFKSGGFVCMMLTFVVATYGGIIIYNKSKNMVYG